MTVKISKRKFAPFYWYLPAYIIFHGDEIGDDQKEAGTSSKNIIKQKKDNILAKRNQPIPKIP